jgi:hypothetical protein
MRTVIRAALVAWVVAVLLPAAAAQEGGTAVVTGRVIDDAGTPLVGARVSFDLPAPRTATTDGDGAFMFTGVPVGSYRISASKAGFYARQSMSGIGPGSRVTVRGGEMIDGVEVRLTPGGAITGRIVDEFGDPIADIQVMAQRYVFASGGSRVIGGGAADRTDDLGRFRVYGLPPGDYAVSARRGGRHTGVEPFGVLLIEPDPLRANEQFAPIFYPGTASPGEAQVVSVSPGAETSVQFPLVSVRLLRVSGHVLTSAGKPASGMRISLNPTSLIAAQATGSLLVAADGTFSFPYVAPGQYRLAVEVVGRSDAIERASMPISVTGVDMTDLTVVTSPTATITGRVRFSTAFTRGTFQLTAIDAAEGPERTGASIVSEPVGADGRFELRGVPERAYLQPVGPAWTMTSMMLDGREMIGEPIDLAGATTLSGVTIAVTDRQTSVAGTLRDGRDRPLANHPVVVLRADGAGPSSQRARPILTDADGAFQIRGLRPGPYVAGAPEDFEAGQEDEGAFHQRLLSSGRRFTLGALPVDLELKPLPGR